MPQALALSGGANVSIPARTLGQSFEFWIDFEINTYENQTFLGRGTGTNNYQVYPIDATTIGWRASSTLNITLSEPIPLNARHYLSLSRNDDATITVKNGAGATIGTLSTTVSLLDISRIGLALNRNFSGKIYGMGLTVDEVEQLYLNESDPSATTFGDGTLNGGTWVEYTNAPAAVPQGVTTIGTIAPGETTASVPYSYSLSDQTGFQYRIDGGAALTASASPISLNGLTAETTYTVEVRAINDTGAGAWASAEFTTTAAAAVPPQGTITVGSITTGETTASIPFSYSDSDQDGFEYRLDGGTALDVVSNPIELTSLTHTTPYDIEVRAVNGAGAGTWSTVAEFTTDTPVATEPVFTSGILHDNNRTPVANTALKHATLYDITTGELVIRVAGAITNSEGRVIIQSALLAANTDYDLNAEMPDGQRIMPRGPAI